MYLIGIDVGGTNTKVGFFDGDNLKEKSIFPTQTNDVKSQIESIVKGLLEKYNTKAGDIDRIAIGCPGLVSDGVVLASANLNLNNVNLAKDLTQSLGIKAYVKNDVDMATLTEMNLGDGKDVSNFVMLTVGTGIGGSIVIDGKLYEGRGVGEFGHMIFKRDGKKCNCGRLGCVEKYLSAIALIEMTKERLQGCDSILKNYEELRASDIARAYMDGDKLAIEIVDKYAEDFSEYLLDICNCLRPERILIGGGLSYAPLIVSQIEKLCKKKNFGYENAPTTDIRVAKFGNDAGIYGVLFA